MTKVNNVYRRGYDTAKENLRVFHQELKALYAHTNLDNRQAAFVKLKEKYGPLDKYQQRQEANLNRAKTALTSKYMTEDGYTGFSFSNDYNADNPFMRTNKFYDKTLDLNSKYNIDIRKRDNITLEEDQETLDRLESKNMFTTSVHTDAWGRDYDHPDFGINPSNINRTTQPVATSNNNNKGEVVNEGEVVSDINTTAPLGAKDGDKLALNTNNKKAPFNETWNSDQDVNANRIYDDAGNTTPNREQLMSSFTQEIRDNPSTIQQGLIDSGFTPERLAGLKIKHKEWKENRKNRKTLFAGKR